MLTTYDSKPISLELCSALVGQNGRCGLQAVKRFHLTLGEPKVITLCVTHDHSVAQSLEALVHAGVINERSQLLVEHPDSPSD